ncbi:MAG: DsrE/DsrF/DrsH-like family protein [Rhodospirillales bacterium]|nr:DsrE/DsrF/DrsH-like family protein [Rhodospirillales bacterium]
MSASIDERPQKLSIIVFSGDFDKVHYALVMASAAAAIDIPTTLFFTMGATRALMATANGNEPAWRGLPAGEIGGDGKTGGDIDDDFKDKTVATFEDLLQACVAMGVKFMICDMGLRAMGLEGASLRRDVPIETGGMVTFLNDAKASGQMVFV